MSVKPLSEKCSTRILAGDASGIEAAANILHAGRLAAFPTETVYGLGADAGNAHAVAALYAAKERPAFNPLIAHVPSLEAARRLGHFTTEAEALARAFWPGPLTLVLLATEDCPVCDLARAGLATVAVRVPAHPVAQALLKAFGGPVVAPSANRSGRVSPTTAAHVAADLDGRVDVILDGGATSVGVESAIVACLPGAPPRLLRPGGVPREVLEQALGTSLEAEEATPASISAPGQLTSHYAPRASVRLEADRVEPGEALLAFGPDAPRGAECAARMLNLSLAGDLVEAAANLFAFLRELDASGAARIAVMPIPEHGLGAAINDRLRRAAAPRG